MEPKFKRVLLKMSGEALRGGEDGTISAEFLSRIATEIKEIHALGIQLAMVVGGGNIIRGLDATSAGIDRATGAHDARLDNWDRDLRNWTFGPGGELWFQAEDDGSEPVWRLDANAGDPTEIVRGGICSGPKPAGDGHVYFSFKRSYADAGCFCPDRHCVSQ